METCPVTKLPCVAGCSEMCLIDKLSTQIANEVGGIILIRSTASLKDHANIPRGPRIEMAVRIATEAINKLGIDKS